MNLRPGPESSGIWTRRDLSAAPAMPISSATTAADSPDRQPPPRSVWRAAIHAAASAVDAHQHAALARNRRERPGTFHGLPDVPQIVHGVLVQFHGLRCAASPSLGS